MICVECDRPIIDEPSHAAHEDGCPVDPLSEDWSCRCDGRAHRACCRACAPCAGRRVEVIPGQEVLRGTEHEAYLAAQPGQLTIEEVPA